MIATAMPTTAMSDLGCRERDLSSMCKTGCQDFSRRPFITFSGVEAWRNSR